MSEWLGFTNQKLYQARLLLDASRRESGADVSGPAMKSGLETGGLYLLHDAYVSYLNELAVLATYRGEVHSLKSLLDKTPLVTGEMTELRILEEEPTSWLSAFLRETEAHGRPGNGASRQAGGMATNLIALANDSSADHQLLSWWQSLSDLIDSQRENRQES